MYFDSFAEALDMAGHGPYVWSAYTITFLVIAGLVWVPMQRTRSLRTQLRAIWRRERNAQGDAKHAP